MFNRNRITLFCLIGSVFGMSMMIGLMRSKPVSSPSASQSSVPPYKPFHLPTPSITPTLVSGEEREFLTIQFSKSLRIFRTKDGDGKEKTFLGYKAPYENPEQAGTALTLHLCEDMARTSSSSEFSRFLNRIYITKNFVMAEGDYQKARDTCLRLLALEKVWRNK